MSHTTEADYKKQIEDLRELHRQAVESAQQAAEETLKAYNAKDLVDAELAALKLQTIPVTSFNTPVPRNNLSNQIQAAGYIDDQRLEQRLHELVTTLTTEAIEREDRLIHHMTALITSSLNYNAIPPSNVSQSVHQNRTRRNVDILTSN